MLEEPPTRKPLRVGMNLLAETASRLKSLPRLKKRPAFSKLKTEDEGENIEEDGRVGGNDGESFVNGHLFTRRRGKRGI